MRGSLMSKHAVFGARANWCVVTATIWKSSKQRAKCVFAHERHAKTMFEGCAEDAWVPIEVGGWSSMRQATPEPDGDAERRCRLQNSWQVATHCISETLTSTSNCHEDTRNNSYCVPQWRTLMRFSTEVKHILASAMCGVSDSL